MAVGNLQEVSLLELPLTRQSMKRSLVGSTVDLWCRVEQSDDFVLESLWLFVEGFTQLCEETDEFGGLQGSSRRNLPPVCIRGLQLSLRLPQSLPSGPVLGDNWLALSTMIPLLIDRPDS